MSFENTPLRKMDYSFPHYLNERKNSINSHMQGNGLPDYAYSEDYNLRKQLDAIPHLYEIGYNICSTYASRTIQELNMYALAVGPKQFPEIYEIGKECARRLGIAVPNIFIVDSPAINASTIATDDVEPVIMLNSALVERYTHGELQMIIGHECGHIHNKHGVYNTLSTLILNTAIAHAGGISGLLNSLVTSGAALALNHWSRAAEITCDRAGMICTDTVEDSYYALAKLLYGAMFHNPEINLDEIEKQLERQQQTIVRLEMLTSSHPSIASRIATQKIFGECDVFYSWRKDMKCSDLKLISKEKADALCAEKLKILKGGDSNG